ncbi:MAG: NAD(P)/FAD-dependent oxidoreductase [Ignavibacteriae bacterium]|nr:NAD(P)/FAD-dependent oxidoreductase [Ignavibacteriota bacterium]
MAEKTIAVLGGGIGGLVATRQLRTLLGRKHKIILVDKSSYHHFPASYIWALLDWRKPDEIRKPLSSLKRYNIRFHNGLVHTLHLNQNVIQTNKEIIWYDYLVIALGAEPAYHQVPGLSMATPTFYTLEGAIHLQSKIKGLVNGKIAIIISGLPYKCPPAPYEAALLLDYYYKNLGRKNIQIEIYSPEETPLSTAGKGMGEALLEILKRRGISFFPNHTISDIQGGRNEIRFENGNIITPDIYTVVPPYQPPPIIRESGITAPNGWVAVDPVTLRTKYPNVFSVGDITTIPLANGLLLPKAGVFAAREADVVANNIAFEIASCGSPKSFDGHGYCFLEAGNGTAGYIKGNFFDRPAPTVSLHKPRMLYHWRKLLYEKYWFFRWF